MTEYVDPSARTLEVYSGEGNGTSNGINKEMKNGISNERRNEVK